MINVFDLSAGMTGTKLLTEKGQRDGTHFVPFIFFSLISHLIIIFFPELFQYVSLTSHKLFSEVEFSVILLM
jgi:hypothetical protein